MAEINNVIAEASQDLQTIEDFVNLPAGSDVRPRLLPSVNVGTLAGTRQAIFEAGGLPATPFATKALMTASALVDGKYAQVTEDSVAANNGLYVKTAGAWVKSGYDPVSQSKSYSEQQRRLGENNVTQMWFIKPYYEWSGNTLYFKPFTLGDNCFYVRDKRYPLDTITRTKFWTDLEAQVTPTRFKVISPSGVTDCIALTALDALLYDHVNKKIVLGARDTVGDYTVLIATDSQQIGACLERDNILTQIAEKKLLADVSNINSKIDDGKNNVTQMWFINPYYELANGTLYVKPQPNLPSTTVFVVKDKRYADDYIVLAKYWSDLSAQVSPEKFKVKSPLGVNECIALTGMEALLYDHVNKKIVLGTRATVGNYTVLVALDNGVVAPCIEEHRILDQISEKKIAQDIRILSSKHKVDLPDGVRGIAHRGYSTVAPENTLPSYVLAATNGFKYVECDVSFSSDDVAMLLHDETIDRTSNGTGTLADMTFAQARAFDYGSWKNAEYAGTQIPTLEEFLKLCRNLGLHPYLEIKVDTSTTKERVESVVALVNRLGMQGKVSYISFGLTILDWIKSADPTARLGYVTGSSANSSVDLAVRFKTNTNSVFVNAGISNVSESHVLYASSKGIGYELWTANNPANVRGYADMGVTGITTDSLDIPAIIKDSYV